jgi:hypothetical protein
MFVLPAGGLTPGTNMDKTRSSPPAALVVGAVIAALVSTMSLDTQAQRQPVPTAVLTPATTTRLPGEVDSNSPAVWDLVRGRPLLHVFTSDGRPHLSISASLGNLLRGPVPISIPNRPGQDGIWIEAIIPDEGGTWYGYYHNEVHATVCDPTDPALPRIGAVRSTDQGRTWVDLGIILEAPPGWLDCDTPSPYLVGGVGDFGVMLDKDSMYLYLFFSQYSTVPSAQGVGVARMPWASRDEPGGRASVWADRVWLPAQSVSAEAPDGTTTASWIYPAGTPLVQVTRPWHDADPVNDAFWGPSIHWNTHLERYVMLLNRTKDEAFSQDGIYVSYAPALHDPSAWSFPQKLLNGGNWYPQVMGLEPGLGTDRVAGARARFFVGGTSTAYIDFSFR